MTIYPLTAVRALALRAQGLHTPNGASTTGFDSPSAALMAWHSPALSPTHEAIYDILNQLGCVQIDTLQMVHRSQPEEFGKKLLAAM